MGFKEGIDAASYSDSNKKLYMLNGDQYVRLSFFVGSSATMDPGYPKPISNWRYLPSEFHRGIDAAFYSDSNKKLYMLDGDQYVRLSFVVGGSATMDPGYPKPISNWRYLPSEFHRGIDAAFYSDSNKKLYMLDGDQYVRLSFVVGGSATMDPGYPKPISNWRYLPSEFHRGIDAAFYSDSNKKLYMLDGDQYVRLSFVVGGSATMDPGYPKPISNWRGLP